MDNTSQVTMFTLSGLSEASSHRFVVFAATLLCYSVIWLANVTVISAVVVDKSLHEPMYIFLCNLCANGLYGTAGFYPKFLSDLATRSFIISYSGCFLQGFVIHSSLSADISILTVMAYDRYVAICEPLAYHSVMTKQRVLLLLCVAWFIPLYLVFVGSMTTLGQVLCGSHIRKIYCINGLINKLACSASLASVVVPAFNYTFYMCHIIFIACSYVFLVRTCVKSKENRKKFLQTCMPHLLCLITVVASLFFDLVYMRFATKETSADLQNFMAIVFLLLPPVFNPVMYGLNMSKIRHRVVKFLCRSNLVCFL